MPCAVGVVVSPWQYHLRYPDAIDRDFRLDQTSCLNRSFAESLGWSIQNAASKPIMIESADWNTVRLSSLVMALLLRDVMLYPNVTIRERTDSIAGGPNENNAASRCGQGYSHILLERWSAEESYYVRWSEQRKLCEKLGEIGYRGMNGWYTNKAALTTSNDIIEYYRSIVLKPDLLKVFEPAAAEPIGNCTHPHCGMFTASDVQAHSRQGRYQTQSCVSNLASGKYCATMYMSTPRYATTILESMAAYYNFPISFEYLGANGDQEALIEQKHNADVPILFYYWEPSALIAKSPNYQRMAFPQYTSSCYSDAGLDRANVVKIPCDFNQQSLINFAWGGLSVYDPSVYKLSKQFSLSLSDISSILADFSNDNRTLQQAACSWITKNVNTWKQWVPTFPSFVQFSKSELQLKIGEVGKVFLPVVREAGSMGTVNISVLDITNSDTGRLHLRSRGLSEAVAGVDYMPIEQGTNAELFWNDGAVGKRDFQVDIYSQPHAGRGMVFRLDQLVTNSGSLGLSVIVVHFVETPCEDQMFAEKKGGFVIFDEIDTAFESRYIAGSVFTIFILVLTLVEIVAFISVIISRYVGHSRKRLNQSANKKCSLDGPRTLEKYSTNSSLWRKMSLMQSVSQVRRPSLSGIKKVFSFREQDQVCEIHPTIENIYPTVACMTDFLQIGAIIFAADLPWLNNSILDYISFSQLPLSWYFIAIVILVFPWEMYMAFILTGTDAKLENHLIGRVILFPSDYLIPIGASILYIPTLSVMFSIFECVPSLLPSVTEFTTPPENAESELFVLSFCSLACWSSEHWPYAVIAGILTSVYVPLALIAAPLWQSIKRTVVDAVGQLDVEYKPKFFVVDSILKYLMVFSRIFLRHIEIYFYTVVIVSLLMYLMMFSFMRPCKVQWIGNLRLFFYLMLSIFSIIAVASFNSTSGDSIWPIALILTIFLVGLVLYIIYDAHRYPKKLKEVTDETRRRIRSFLQEYNDTELDSITDDGSNVDYNDSVQSDKSSHGVEGSRDANAEWSLLEKDVKRLKNSGKLFVQEIEYLTFLVVKKSSLLKFIWELSKSSTSALKDINQGNKKVSLEEPEIFTRPVVKEDDLFLKYLKWMFEDSTDYEQFHKIQGASRTSYSSFREGKRKRHRGSSLQSVGADIARVLNDADGASVRPYRSKSYADENISEDGEILEAQDMEYAINNLAKENVPGHQTYTKETCAGELEESEAEVNIPGQTRE